MRKTPFRKNPGVRPLADLIGSAIDPVLARQGFGQSDLILFWDEIVGERLAAMSQPIKLQWPPRRADPEGGFAPATLVVRVESAFALELQHLSDAVLEKVNAHFGWRCVSRLALRQGPVERRAAAKARAAPIDPDAEQRAQHLVENVADEGLRRALTRLGARVLAGPPRGPW